MPPTAHRRRGISKSSHPYDTVLSSPLLATYEGCQATLRRREGIRTISTHLPCHLKEEVVVYVPSAHDARRCLERSWSSRHLQSGLLRLCISYGAPTTLRVAPTPIFERARDGEADSQSRRCTLLYSSFGCCPVRCWTSGRKALLGMGDTGCVAGRRNARAVVGSSSNRSQVRLLRTRRTQSVGEVDRGGCPGRL